MDKSRKIILLCSGLKRAGQEKVVFELATALKLQGKDVMIISFYGGPYANELRDIDIPVKVLLDESTTKFYRLKLVFSFLRIILKYNQEVFVIHGLGFENLWLIASKFKKLKSIFVFHNNYEFLQTARFHPTSFRFRLFLRNIHKKVFIKINIYNTAIKNGFIKSDNNNFIIENGIGFPFKIVDLKKRENLKISLGFKKNDFLMVQVGRFVDQKNQLMTIKAFEKAEFNNNIVKLVLIGDGPNFKECQNYVSLRKLESRVTLTGNIKNVSDYLNISNIFLLPSMFEGHPIALIEAMMLDLPSIVFRSKGIEDFLPDSLDSLKYTTDKSVYALVKEMQNSVENYESILKESKFKSSIEWVKRNYSREVMVEKYNEIFYDW